MTLHGKTKQVGCYLCAPAGGTVFTWDNKLMLWTTLLAKVLLSLNIQKLILIFENL